MKTPRLAPVVCLVLLLSPPAGAMTLDAVAALSTLSYSDALSDAETPDELSRAMTFYQRDFGLLSRLGDLVPVVQALQASPMPEDRYLALLISGRIAMSTGDDATAMDLLRRAEATARAAGFGDRQIVSALADLAVLAHNAGDAKAAQAWLERAHTCPDVPCPTDLLGARLAVGDAAPSLRTAPLPPRSARDAAVRDFLLRVLPGRSDLWPDYLRSTAASLSEEFPILAAQYYETATYLTLRSATSDSDPTSLHSLILAAMRQNLIANRFSTVGRLAAAWMDRRGEIEVPTIRLTFRRLQLRARFRDGAPEAGGDYTLLVDVTLKELATTAPEARAPVIGAAFEILDDVMDTANLPAAARLADALLAYENSFHLWTRIARIRIRQGDPAAAADILRQLRELVLTQDAPDFATVYTVQEAAYRDAAGESDVAAALRSTLAPVPDAIPPRGTALEKPEGFTTPLETRLRAIIEFRDHGNYEGAAWLLSREVAFIPTYGARGRYSDAQWLWQMAYTFARGGRQALAFDTMRRAAAIAARLSFADPSGPEGGTLQLLQRDRWRYLLFIDIAWAAANGLNPEEMLVVSDY